MRRLVLGGLILAMMFATAPTAVADKQGPDWYSTDNVKYIKTIREVADGVGGVVVGNYLYVTSTKGLYIYDIGKPEDPKQVGSLTVQVHWENEEVPTNGKILGLSSSDGCTALGSTTGTPDPSKRANCLSLYDVTDKANPKLITSVWNAGPHTATCILDCQYMWGSDGTIVDLRHVLDPGHPAPIIGNWRTGQPGMSAHHQVEVRPGIVLTATQPIMLMSINPEDGGRPDKPVLLATGANDDGRFIHSVRWPNRGSDPIMLAGGETNFNLECIQVSGAFMTWDTTRLSSTHKFYMMDEYRTGIGTFSNGQPPATVLGCSVHWFEAHRTFNGGGLVALAAYEAGTRFLQITPRGKIKEQGWFQPIGGATSAPHWAPDGKTIYAVDYERGIDVIQWTGPLYVPEQGVKGQTAAGPQVNPGGALPLSSTGGALPRALAVAVVMLAVLGLARSALARSRG